jgi:hypothetical protein
MASPCRWGLATGPEVGSSDRAILGAGAHGPDGVDSR